MHPTTILPYKTKRLFGLMGLSALLLIIPVKAVRWIDYSPMISPIIDIAPSVLGPIGLLYLLLSSVSPRIARLSLPQATFLVGAIAMGLEFAQLIPRPGILAKVHYTFDWLDVAASLFSVSLGYIAARWLIHRGIP
jgi:hypothetical protein